jgi:F-type H+-transporting ATPase subunit b
VPARNHLPKSVLRALTFVIGVLLAHALPTGIAGDGLASRVHAAEAHHHDPYDLSLGDASDRLENPMEVRYDLALATFAVFLVLVTILTRFAWGPIRDGLDRREATIANRIAEAEASAATAAAELEKHRAQLAAASEEARAIVDQARHSAEDQAARIVEQAHEAAQRERERAALEIQAAKEHALREVARSSADLAVGLAGRILHREVRPDDHAALIREALERFPSQN